MKRMLEINAILFFACLLYSCGYSQIIGIEEIPTFTMTSTLTNTLKPNPSPTQRSTEYPTRMPDPTCQLLPNGWYRFTYREAGYMIDYPPDTHFETDNSIILDYTQVIIRFPGSIDPTGVALLLNTKINKENISLEEFVEIELFEIFHGNPPEVFGITTIKEAIFAGHSSLIFDANLYRQIIFICAKDKFYILSLVPNMMIGNPTTNDAIVLFYKIVDTFNIF